MQKAGLIELTGDDQNTLLGGMLMIAELLLSDGGAASLSVLKRKGRNVFRRDKESISGDAPAPW